MQYTATPSAPQCPRCGAAMRLRLQRSSGKSFFGCLAYPKCKGTVSVPDACQDPLPGLDRELLQLREALHQARVERDLLQGQTRCLMQELEHVRQSNHALIQDREHLLRLLKEAPHPNERHKLDKALKALLTVVHPDRFGGDNPVANELTKHLVALRDKLKEGRQ